MGKLIIVRHGETDYNVQGRYTGQTDISLNAAGMEQARLTAEKLRDEAIDLIICSTLKRAIETANIINKKLHLPMLERNELIELCMGVYQGLTKEEIIEKYPEMWESQSPKGREDFSAVEDRVFKVIEDIKREYSGKNVLVVTHGYIAKVINKYFNNPSEEEFHKYFLHNCDYSVYVI